MNENVSLHVIMLQNMYCHLSISLSANGGESESDSVKEILKYFCSSIAKRK